MTTAGRKIVVEADGGSRGNPGPAGYGAVVRDAATGEVLAERAAGIGRATNNVAEYSGLIAGLAAAAELAPAEVEVRMDSKLVVEQMSGRWRVRHPDLAPLAAEAAELARRLPAVRFTWVPRESNQHADRLANEAMDAAAAGRTGIARPRAARSQPTSEDAQPASERPSGGPPRGWAAAGAPPTTLLLQRHGQTALSVERRFSGRGDAPLTPVGETQAAAAARHLAAAHPDTTAVLSSPLRRARATADPVAAALGLPVTVDEALAETDFGAWEGYTFAEVQAGWPEEMSRWLADPAVAPPGGESFAATAVRIERIRQRALADFPGRTVVLVTHVTPIKTLLRVALDAGPSALQRIFLDLASLSIVDWYPDGAAVVRLVNGTAHLPAG